MPIEFRHIYRHAYVQTGSIINSKQYLKVLAAKNLINCWDCCTVFQSQTSQRSALCVHKGFLSVVSSCKSLNNKSSVVDISTNIPAVMSA